MDPKELTPAEKESAAMYNDPAAATAMAAGGGTVLLDAGNNIRVTSAAITYFLTEKVNAWLVLPQTIEDDPSLRTCLQRASSAPRMLSFSSHPVATVSEAFSTIATEVLAGLP